MTFAIAGTLLAAVDLRVHRLPTPVLTYALIVVGVLIGAASVAAGDLAILRNAVAAGAVVGASYLALALLLPGRLGMGDIRLAALASVLLGTQGWDTVILGAILPYVSAAPIVAVQILRGGVQRHSQLPFGPYLIIGALASVLLSG
ncbi:MAG TPA: A24 family peptidase [Catenuloplanes sp.]